MLTLRDLPGVADVEASTRLNLHVRAGTDRALSRRVQDVTRTVFGIADGTDYPLPDWYVPGMDLTDEVQERLTDAWSDWEAHFDIEECAECEMVGAWRALGWDVTDKGGFPLQCLENFERAMVCVTKGLRGNTLDQIAAAIWAAKLTPAKTEVSAKQRARNSAFLELGARHSRKMRA